MSSAKSITATSLTSQKVLRYSALVFGILYGFQHQRSITANTRAAHAEAEYKHKTDLIQKAKLEWAKKTLPPSAKTDGGDGKSTTLSASCVEYGIVANTSCYQL